MNNNIHNVMRLLTSCKRSPTPATKVNNKQKKAHLKSIHFKIISKCTTESTKLNYFFIIVRWLPSSIT